MNYDIYINSTIGYPFSADFVRGELERIGEAPCRVYLSSLGGAVVDALQIRQMFLEHGNVTVCMHGFVASAATIIATGARRIVMGEHALLLVHRCANTVDEWGTMNAEEIAAVIEKLKANRTALETIDQTIANIYAARCKCAVEDAARWMHNAEWLTAAQCLEMHLTDEVEKEDAAPGFSDHIRNELTACRLPLPKLLAEEEAKRKNVFAALCEYVVNSLSGTFSEKISAPATDTDNRTTINTSHMNPQDYPLIAAVLSAAELPALAANDGKAALSIEQMTALENRLSALAAEHTAQVADSERQIADLKKQIAALEKQDGAETTHIEGSAAAQTDYAARVRSDYAKLKHLG